MKINAITHQDQLRLYRCYQQFELNDKMDKVETRQDFITFLEKFRADLIENTQNWENLEMSDFLEAMIRYTEDIQGYYKNTNQPINADEPTWQVFADILIGASIYE